MILLSEEKDLDEGKLLKKLKEVQNRKDEITENLERYNDSLSGKRPAEVIAEGVLKMGKNNPLSRSNIRVIL